MFLLLLVSPRASCFCRLKWPVLWRDSHQPGLSDISKVWACTPSQCSSAGRGRPSRSPVQAGGARRVEARVEGRVKGRVKGRVEGRVEGRVKGRVEGRVA